MICGSGRAGSGSPKSSPGGRGGLRLVVDSAGIDAAFGEALLEFAPLAFEAFGFQGEPSLFVGFGHFSSVASFHPFRRPRGDLPGRGDRMEAGEQDQARDVEQSQDDDRTDAAEQIFQQQAADPFADPAPGTGDIQPFHVEQRPGQEVGEARARGDESHAPPGPRGEAEFRVEQLGAAVAEQERREQIGSGAEEGVAAAGDDRTRTPNEIQHRPAGGGDTAQRKPRRHVGGRIGNEGEKKERAETEQHEAEHFVQGVGIVFLGAGH